MAAKKIAEFLSGPDTVLNVYGATGVGKTRLIRDVVTSSGFTLVACPSCEEQRALRAGWYRETAVANEYQVLRNIVWHAPYGVQDVPEGILRRRERPAYKWIIETIGRGRLSCAAVQLLPPKYTERPPAGASLLEAELIRIAPTLSGEEIAAVLALSGPDYRQLALYAGPMLDYARSQRCGAQPYELPPKMKAGRKPHGSNSSDDPLQRLAQASEVKVLHDMLAATDQSLFFAPEIPHMGCSKCKYSHRGCKRCRAKWFASPDEEDLSELRARRSCADACRGASRRLPWKNNGSSLGVQAYVAAPTG